DRARARHRWRPAGARARRRARLPRRARPAAGAGRPARARAHRARAYYRRMTESELRTLQHLTAEADRMIEESVRDRLSLRVLMDRFLPATERWFDAKGALVTTRNEHLVQETFTWGQWKLLGGVDLGAAEGHAQVHGHGTALWISLRVAGQEVG